jgi:hypothetical protein
MHMSAGEKLAELRVLQAKIDAIRQALEISAPGTVTFFARTASDDAIVLVEADGFGAATTSIVEGNYPIDYITKFQETFSTERQAEAIAEAVAFNGFSLAEFSSSPI